MVGLSVLVSVWCFVNLWWSNDCFDIGGRRKLLFVLYEQLKATYALMSVIDIEHAINILIITDGNDMIIEHVRLNRNGVSINDCGYGLTSV